MTLNAEQRALIKRAIDNKARNDEATRGIQHARKVGRGPVTVRPEPEALLVPIVSTQPNPSNRRCKGCGGHLDEFTVGCNTCRSRHYYRYQRQQSQQSG